MTMQCPRCPVSLRIPDGETVRCDLLWGHENGGIGDSHRWTVGETLVVHADTAEEGETITAIALYRTAQEEQACQAN